MRTHRQPDCSRAARLRPGACLIRQAWTSAWIVVTLGMTSLVFAQIAADDDIEYVVIKGDTLINIGIRLLENPTDWPRLVEINRIGRQNALPVGMTLRIPKELLRSQSAQAIVSVVSGSAQVNGQAALVGQKVAEAALLSTAADGLLEIRLGDGSTLKLTPGSRVRLERLRRYHRDEVIEARTILEQGRVEVQASPQRRKPLEIRTPFATAAVRGTQFRVGAAQELVTSEVLNGAVSWGATSSATSGATSGANSGANRGAAIELAGGFGSAGSRNGVLPAERLLPAPDLSRLPNRIQDAALSAPFAAVPQASAYRIQVSADARFNSILQEQVSRVAQVDYLTRADGTLYLRIRPIAGSSVEGIDQTAQIEVQARPFAPNPRPTPNSGILFVPQAALSWNPAELASAYQLQMSADANFSQIVGEQRVNATTAELALATGAQHQATRYWRVAGVNASGGYLGPYSAAQSLRYYAPPDAPSLVRSTVEQAVLSWPKRTRERYALEIADNPAFAQARRIETAGGEQQIDQLKPGRYFARLAALADDGVTTPYSASLEFRVKSGFTSGSGLPLESGSGFRIESPSY
jgi:hypothetical protein